MSAIEKLLDWYENLPENDKAEWRAKDILPHIIMTQAARINAVEQAEARALLAEEKAGQKAPAELIDLVKRFKTGEMCEHQFIIDICKADLSCYHPAPDRTEELVKRLKEWRHDYAHKPLLSATTLMDRFDVILRDFEGEK